MRILDADRHGVALPDGEGSARPYLDTYWWPLRDLASTPGFAMWVSVAAHAVVFLVASTIIVQTADDDTVEPVNVAFERLAEYDTNDLMKYEVKQYWESRPRLREETIDDLDPEPVLESVSVEVMTRAEIRETDVVINESLLPDVPEDQVTPDIPNPVMPVSNTAAAVIPPTPELGHNRPPEYPRLARRRGIEGVVIMVMEVGADGHVTAVRVHESSGHALLDRAATRAAQRWRFNAAVHDGRRVASQYKTAVRFALRDTSDVEGSTDEHG